MRETRSHTDPQELADDRIAPPGEADAEDVRAWEQIEPTRPRARDPAPPADVPEAPTGVEPEEGSLR